VDRDVNKMACRIKYKSYKFLVMPSTMQHTVIIHHVHEYGVLWRSGQVCDCLYWWDVTKVSKVVFSKSAFVSLSGWQVVKLITKPHHIFLSTLWLPVERCSILYYTISNESWLVIPKKGPGRNFNGSNGELDTNQEWFTLG